MDVVSQLQGVASIAYIGVLVCIFAYVVFRSVQWRSQIRPLFSRVWLLVVPAFALSLCSVWFGYVHADYSELFRALELPPPMIRSQASTMANLMAVGGLIGASLSAFYSVLLLSTAELQQDQSAYPWLLHGRRTTGLGLGALLGVGFAIVSVPLFAWMSVESSAIIEQQNAMLFPNVDFSSAQIVLTATLPMMLGAAISEELLFRGLLLRALHRFFGPTQLAAAGAIVFSSFVWSLGHAVNTDQVVLKLGQIFLMGLVLGWLSVKHSVEASLAAHLAFNTVVVLWFLLA